MADFLANVWDFVKRAGRAIDGFLPPVVTYFMKEYPGLTVAAVAAGNLFWVQIGRMLP